MNAKVIRQKFLQFFEEKGHKIVPSAPIVVQNDPTLMFTNAGMNQFKDFFLGNREASVKRAVDTQKCLRVSGKHNDLEEVGFDTYHHTMFEMLGNWSFGDYFKQEAIDWAWELLTDVYDLPKDRLYATVFEGDKSEELELDAEAKDIWAKHLPADRILLGNKKDNFWEMGDVGPCGPCSEIHIDLRPQSEIEKVSGALLVNQDHPQVVEVWNLVFMEFTRLANGSLQNLPQKHVDTGMGFERLAMAIQSKQSNYDTDVFSSVIEYVAKKAGISYGDDNKNDIAVRVIADHIRAISFTIADGQLPSNAKAGYVIRRILRRAVRYGYTFLGFREPFLYELVPLVAQQFEDVFPELPQQKDFVSKVVKEEENAFLRTLENGLKKLEVISSSGKKEIAGAEAFELYDTYGFPLDLTMLIAKENGLKVDESGFEVEMAQQKNRSKSAAQQDAGDWVRVNDLSKDSVFVGYDALEAECQIVKYRSVKAKSKEVFHLVLNTTPFYAESGGQVGDKGVLVQGEKKINIYDTKKENDLVVHFSDKLPEDLSGFFDAKVNPQRRRLTQNNHTSTHLLQSALRSVLGDHVQQRGSLVNESVLRFDFSHFSKLTDEEISTVEKMVNEKIRENISLNEKRNIPVATAKEMGATALFGEKYGDFVRVITFDPSYSVELCGGTHVQATGQIGLFKIASESSVAAGVRRIEAITAETAESFLLGRDKLLTEIEELLKRPKDTIKTIEALVDEKGKLQKQLESVHLQQSRNLKEDLIATAEKTGDISLIFYQGLFPDANVIKQLVFELKNEMENVAVFIAAEIDGKPNLTVIFSDQIVKEKSLDAGAIVRTMAKEIQGGGGGQPFFATAGGKDIKGLEAALSIGRQYMKDQLQ
ncbi:MAG: alanyl-tRNA synthetase [Cyclobacteriaceae bacterium]|jgi:alanyl-tRNA synthetase